MTLAGRLIRALLAAVLLAFALPLSLQAQTGTPDAAEQGIPDYAAWQRTATKAEALTDDSTATDEALNEMRGYLVNWRATFQAAQSVNATKIAILRGQIDALGPTPTEGAAEAEEIADRRRELNAQLVQLQAPGITADEAYRQADGLIREMDRVLRERQADELLQLWPSPINPANLPAAVKALTDSVVTLWTESSAQWNRPLPVRQLKGNLPLIAVDALVGLILLLRGRVLMTRLFHRVQMWSAARWHRIWSLVLSVGQVLLPTAGALLLSKAARLSNMLGPQGLQLADLLPALVFAIFSAIWLGNRVFPKLDTTEAPLTLPPERRAEGRFYVTIFGLLIGLDGLRSTLVSPTVTDRAATSVLAFPILVVAGIMLARVGQLLRSHVTVDNKSDDAISYRNRLISLFGFGAQVIGVVGPVLAAIGYVSAAGALVYPAALSLALLGFIFVLQDLVDTVHALLTRRDVVTDDALVPTLIGFGIVMLSMPVFALIWGVRPSDLGELWTQFLSGFSIGATRISPRDFIVFGMVFGIGYALTQLMQGALRSSVLPKTKLDQGGKNALLSGLGYVGVFLSALVAINAAGINLAGLAIVAGALSVGIGFGLQNIVSNFVSGIILLIERPVSEGDWIEVGGVQGTVKAISVRSTRIQTFDRTDVIVPNTDLIAGQVTNWTRYNLTGRLIVPVSVGYDADTQMVTRILLDIAEAQPLVVLNPAPVALLMGLGADAMNFELRMILRDVNFSLSVRSDVNHEIIRRFRAANITIPAPQRPTAPPFVPALLPVAAVQIAQVAHRDEAPDGDGPGSEVP